MNKNLKKVISAVAVLAMSASSVVALAANYPDVAETASYAQAVEELSALGIINGYDDGTFGPDKNVTRAEFAKMTVAALGTDNIQSAESQEGSDTQFADVPGTHWASGWVSEGVSTGFINGYSDTAFGPDDNVTYAQAVKMLVCAVGYDFYATQAGGWPSGYLTYGVKLGITNGVKAGTDEIITRAQVAQMIDNAVKAPICVIEDYETGVWGNREAKYETKDTLSTYIENSWESLLTYGHDVYNVYGRVIETPASSTGMKNDQVKVRVEKSNNYDGFQVTTTGNYANYDAKGENMYIGDSKADKYLFTYAEMLVQKDEDGEFTVLTIKPQGTNVSKTIAADDYDKLSSDAKTLYAFENGSTRSATNKLEVANIYDVDNKMNANGGFFVNNKQISIANQAALEAAVKTYIEENPTGTVTLIDSPEPGKSSTDGSYDYIMVTKYVDAVVDNARVKSETETVVTFEVAEGRLSRWTVDTDDDTKTYDITLDGAKISAAELQEDDVISIAYDVTGSFDESATYTAVVSRNTVSATVSTVTPGEGDTDEAVRLDTEYVLSDGNTYKVSSLVDSELTAGDEYTLYLNAFGRIAKYEKDSSSALIGILESVYTANGDQKYANIITKDGEKVNVTVKSTNYNAYRALVYPDVNNTDVRKPIQDRVCEYKINSKNELSKVEMKAAVNAGKATDLTYKSSSNKLGSYGISDSLTSILDTADYNDDQTVTAITTEGLDNDQEYSNVYIYDRNSDATYSFILIDANGTGYTVETKFVVYSKWGKDNTEDGSRDVIYAYADGDDTVQKFVCDDGTDIPAGIAEGDPILLKKNSSGQVTDVTPIFSSYNIVKSGYTSFFNKAMPGTVDLAAMDNMITGAKEWAHRLSYNANGEKKKHYTDFYFGPIIDRTDKGLTIGSFDATYTDKYVSDKTAIEELDFGRDDAEVYVYDYDMGTNNRLSVGIKSSIVKTQISKSDYLDNDLNIINWSGMDANTINFALVKTVDDEITQVYVIVPSDRD